MARDFDRQVAEVQVRVAILNGYTALGIPVTKAVGQIRLGKGENRSSADMRNKTLQTAQMTNYCSLLPPKISENRPSSFPTTACASSLKRQAIAPSSAGNVLRG
jgi:hypothetical protein